MEHHRRWCVATAPVFLTKIVFSRLMVQHLDCFFRASSALMDSLGWAKTDLLWVWRWRLYLVAGSVCCFSTGLQWHHRCYGYQVRQCKLFRGEGSWLCHFRYADNIAKNFAVALSMLFSSVLSILFFGEFPARRGKKVRVILWLQTLNRQYFLCWALYW